MRGRWLEAEVVLGGGRLAPPCLQQAHHVGVQVTPGTGVRRVGLHEAVEPGFRLGARHRYVAGEDVVERRDVGGALDVRVAAQGQDPTAGPPDVAQQQLEDGRGADVLNANGVLGPSHRVDERRRALRPRVRAQRLRHLPEVGPGDAADPLHDLRGVAVEVALQDLEHAARVLEVEVHLGRQSPRERDAVCAVRLLPRDVALALALHPRVAPGRRCRTRPSPGSSPRTARPGPRCPRTPAG